VCPVLWYDKTTFGIYEFFCRRSSEHPDSSVSCSPTDCTFVSESVSSNGIAAGLLCNAGAPAVITFNIEQGRSADTSYFIYTGRAILPADQPVARTREQGRDIDIHFNLIGPQVLVSDDDSITHDQEMWFA
jgi:hypothetical protein